MAAAGPAAGLPLAAGRRGRPAPGPGRDRPRHRAVARLHGRRRGWTPARTRAARRRACTASTASSAGRAAPGTVFVSREAHRRGLARRGRPPRPDPDPRAHPGRPRGRASTAGPGVDSRERYIYLHGTNHEDRLGEPVSARLRAPGQPRRGRTWPTSSAKETPLSSSDPQARWLHFAGAGGSGMSALAQFHAQAGGRATGSDRAFDRGERAEVRAALEALGVVITPQDGSFTGGPARPLRRRGGQHRGRGRRARRGRGPRRRHPPAAPLGAAGALRRGPPHHRRHRHQRQVHRHGHGLQHPAGRGPGPGPADRRRPGRPAARRPPGQRLGAGAAGRARPPCW